MSKRFEDLTRAMARPMPRRGAIKILGATFAAGAAATVAGPMRADARTRGTCKAGQTPCGHKCCDAGAACTHSGCCCPSGTTPCGNKCCKSGVACVDATRGVCGCPSGTTPCMTGKTLHCCPAGQACGGRCPRPHNTVAKHC